MQPKRILYSRPCGTREGSHSTWRGAEPDDQAGVREDRNRGRRLHTFRHSVGSILADMGEHQLTIRDYVRHSNLNVTNQYLQATSKTKRLAQDKLVDAILPSGLLSASKSDLIQ
jgi:integrase